MYVRIIAAGIAVWLVAAPGNALAQLRGTLGGVGGAPIGALNGPGALGTGNVGGFGADSITGSTQRPLDPNANAPLAPSPPVSVLPQTGAGPRLPGTVTNTLDGSLNRAPSLGQARETVGTAIDRPIGRLPSTIKSAPSRRTGVPPGGEQRFVAREVIISLPSGIPLQTLDALAQRHRLTRVESHRIELTGTTMHRWRFSDQRSVSDVIRALEGDSGVRAAQPNYRYRLQQDVAPTGGTPPQYTVMKLNLAQAHRFASGQRVLIAVIDSGIDASHPELADAIAGRFDAVASNDPPHDHGTAVAGAIAAHARLTGSAPGAQILAIRAFDAHSGDAETTTLTLLRSIDWAIEHGARVINMSFAGPRDPQLAASLAAARRKGIVLIAAAGNAGPKSPPLYPAADANVIAVTATDAADRLFARSNRGPHIAVAAPGVDILLPAAGGGYQTASGTSFASAYVSGIAALLLEMKPGLTPAALQKILLATAKDLGPKGRDDQFGAGLADAYAAILALGINTAGVREPEPLHTGSAGR